LTNRHERRRRESYQFKMLGDTCWEVLAVAQSSNFEASLDGMS
jgi:hypothetical protein